MYNFVKKIWNAFNFIIQPMKERLFRFKKFSVSHSESAMKVGVDGVLIGVWTNCRGDRILDVGCGCGLIALLLAQRNEDAHIEAIDIDSPSVREAKMNVANSPWMDRVTVKEISFDEIWAEKPARKYDLIVSNPPFFDAGVSDPTTPRELSRHQGSLSPRVLAAKASVLLADGGRLSLIAPYESADDIIAVAEKNGLAAVRINFVRDNPSAPVKRVMIEFAKVGDRQSDNGSISLLKKEVEPKILTLFRKPMEPTEEYRDLCKDFYLKF